MIDVTNKKDCCGCTACYSICPRSCIAMVPDKEGFLCPKIDTSECLHCGKCAEVCPMKNKTDSGIKPLNGYVVRTLNADRRKRSSSGGLVSSILCSLSEKGYYICGASFDKQYGVHHFIGEPGSNTDIFTGSKYVQSDLGDSFKKIEKILMEGGNVCFVGTGCQVDGLLNYLGKHFDGLFTIGLVCHGVPSHNIWRKYIDYQEKRYNSKITDVNFRDKTLGYQTPAIRLAFENGKQYLATARVDLMLKSYFKHYSLRYSCFQCPSKGIKRRSDITVFDCWNSKELIGLDDNYGYTAVLVNSKKGQSGIEALKGEIIAKEVAVDDLIPAGGGGMVLNSAKYVDKRESFYEAVEELGLESISKTVLGIRTRDRIVERVKVVLAKAGIMKSISRFRRLMKRRYSGKRSA